MQRMMQAAVHATEEWLIAPRYMIQISAHLALSYTKCVLLALQNTCRHILDASQSDLHEHFLRPKKTITVLTAHC